MEAQVKRFTFARSGYYFLGLIALVLVGFWPSYFAKLLDGSADYAFYFHLHAVMMALWMSTLVVQPILIKSKNLALHKAIGKMTYGLFPAMLLSVILLAKSRVDPTAENVDLRLFVPFKDILLLVTFYGIAIWHRKDMAVHARAMIATGIVFIEPALARWMFYAFFTEVAPGYAVTIGIIYALILLLIGLEWRQKKGRWVFPLLLAMYMAVHSVVIFQIHVWPWQQVATWFAGL
jgi:hypothetical protein